MTIPYEIKLNDPNGNGVYYAGQVVSGTVSLNLSKKLTVTNISITVKGYAYWMLQERKSEYHFATYKGQEEFINETNNVVQSVQNGPNIELQVGQHEYNFASRLPHIIPPSFESQVGHIRYRVILLIKRSLKFDFKRIVQFTVLIPLNLNTFDALIRKPKSFKKNYTSFFSNANKLELKIGLERTGFAIGDTMRINVEALNHSKSDIHAITIEIHQLILYATIRRGKRKTRSERRTTFLDSTRKLARLSHSKFDHCITIPYMPVTINTSRIISVSYELVVSPSSQWTSIKIPIIIGNIPITDMTVINLIDFDDNKK